MSRTILRTEQLKAYYVLDVHGTQKVVKAVDGVDLDIRENEVYGIAGESGCGKTTLLKALAAAIEPPLRLIGGKVIYHVSSGSEIDAEPVGLLSMPDAEVDRYMTEGEIDVAYLSAEGKRRLRWRYISYVPQGSMSVLNPVAKLKDTYRDFIESHVSGRRGGTPLRWPRSISPNWGCRPRSWMPIPPVVRRHETTGDDRPGGAAEAADHHRR